MAPATRNTRSAGGPVVVVASSSAAAATTAPAPAAVTKRPGPGRPPKNKVTRTSGRLGAPTSAVADPLPATQTAPDSAATAEEPSASSSSNVATSDSDPATSATQQAFSHTTSSKATRSGTPTRRGKSNSTASQPEDATSSSSEPTPASEEANAHVATAHTASGPSAMTRRKSSAASQRNRPTSVAATVVPAERTAAVDAHKNTLSAAATPDLSAVAESSAIVGDSMAVAQSSSTTALPTANGEGSVAVDKNPTEEAAVALPSVANVPINSTMPALPDRSGSAALKRKAEEAAPIAAHLTPSSAAADNSNNAEATAGKDRKERRLSPSATRKQDSALGGAAAAGSPATPPANETSAQRSLRKNAGRGVPPRAAKDAFLVGAAAADNKAKSEQQPVMLPMSIATTKGYAIVNQLVATADVGAVKILESKTRSGRDAAKDKVLEPPQQSQPASAAAAGKRKRKTSTLATPPPTTGSKPALVQAVKRSASGPLDITKVATPGTTVTSRPSAQIATNKSKAGATGKPMVKSDGSNNHSDAAAAATTTTSSGPRIRLRLSIARDGADGKPLTVRLPSNEEDAVFKRRKTDPLPGWPRRADDPPPLLMRTAFDGNNKALTSPSNPIFGPRNEEEAILFRTPTSWHKNGKKQKHQPGSPDRRSSMGHMLGRVPNRVMAPSRETISPPATSLVADDVRAEQEADAEEEEDGDFHKIMLLDGPAALTELAEAGEKLDQASGSSSTAAGSAASSAKASRRNSVSEDGTMATAPEGSESGSHHSEQGEGDEESPADTPATTPRTTASNGDLPPIPDEAMDDVTLKEEQDGSKTTEADAAAAAAKKEPTAPQRDAVFAHALPLTRRRIDQHAGQVTLSLPFEEMQTQASWLRGTEADDEAVLPGVAAPKVMARVSPNMRRVLSTNSISSATGNAGAAVPNSDDMLPRSVLRMALPHQQIHHLRHPQDEILLASPSDALRAKAEPAEEVEPISLDAAEEPAAAAVDVTNPDEVPEEAWSPLTSSGSQAESDEEELVEEHLVFEGQTALSDLDHIWDDGHSSDEDELPEDDSRSTHGFTDHYYEDEEDDEEEDHVELLGRSRARSSPFVAASVPPATEMEKHLESPSLATKRKASLPPPPPMRPARQSQQPKQQQHEFSTDDDDGSDSSQESQPRRSSRPVRATKKIALSRTRSSASSNGKSAAESNGGSTALQTHAGRRASQKKRR